MQIVVTSQELEIGRLAKAHLEHSCQALRQEGYVILEDVVDHHHLDRLYEKMAADSQKLIAAKEWGGAARVPGHLQQDPPPFAPYIFQDIVANPLVVQITKAILGEGLYCGFYSGNTNCPGSSAQPLHLDNDHLWPDLPAAHPAHALVVNVCLVDVTEENGSTEFWPGSHLETRAKGRVSEGLQAARRRTAPPIRGNTKKGSVLIRDPRLWHRGVPNQADEPRHMIATIHSCHWLQRRPPLAFAKGCESILTSSDLEWNAVFVDEPIDYLLRSRR